MDLEGKPMGASERTILIPLCIKDILLCPKSPGPQGGVPLYTIYRTLHQATKVSTMEVIIEGFHCTCLAPSLHPKTFLPMRQLAQSWIT